MTGNFLSRNFVIVGNSLALGMLARICLSACAIAGEEVTPTVPGHAAPAAAHDPFVGNYAGTFHPLGEHGGKPKPQDGKEFKPRQCGTCHAGATIERIATGYRLTMLVDHGKDKEGKPKKDRISIDAPRGDKGLSFSNASYSIAVADGEASGHRTGRMAAEIKLKRTP